MQVSEFKNRPILVKETGKIYRDVEWAAMYLFTKPYILLRLIKSGNPYQTIEGKRIHLEFTNQQPTDQKRYDLPIRVKETGRIYRNIQEAREQTGIIESAIIRLLESGRQGRTIYGQRIHLEYVEDE